MVTILLWPKPTPAYTVEVHNWVQNSDGTITVDTMNISIWSYSKTMKDNFTNLEETGQATWYVDEVIPDQSTPYHFHFQGQTMLLTDKITADLQTSIANISSNPAFYAVGGEGGWPQWAINITVLDVF
jgi:hypothetical protein